MKNLPLRMMKNDFEIEKNSLAKIGKNRYKLLYA